MANLMPATGKFQAYGIVRDAFGKVKVDDLDKIQDPVMRKLIEDAIRQQENDSGSDPSRSR